MTIAERPELRRAACPLACEGYADLALDGAASISLESWLREEATLPAGSFVALEGAEVVGYSGLLRHDNEGSWRAVSPSCGATGAAADWRSR